jgi:hypothetical protein
MSCNSKVQKFRNLCGIIANKFFFLVFLAIFCGSIVGTIYSLKLDLSSICKLKGELDRLFSVICIQDVKSEIFKLEFISNIKFAAVIWVFSFFPLMFGAAIIAQVFAKSVRISYVTTLLVRAYENNGFLLSLSLFWQNFIFMLLFLFYCDLIIKNNAFTFRNKCFNINSTKKVIVQKLFVLLVFTAISFVSAFASYIFAVFVNFWY